VTGSPATDKTKCGSDGTLFGFPCCKDVEKVGNDYKDSKGFRYGTEEGKSCIVPLPKA
jgi:hypothetical protein